jgi:uncharacterized protein YeaO (DUF488 family)
MFRKVNTKACVAVGGLVQGGCAKHKVEKWFSHDATKWNEFQQRYRAELEAQPQVWKPLFEAARKGTITLVYSSHGRPHSEFVV